MAESLWLLVAISQGMYAQGTVTVLSAYETHAQCYEQEKYNTAAIGNIGVKFACIRARGNK